MAEAENSPATETPRATTGEGGTTAEAAPRPPQREGGPSGGFSSRRFRKFAPGRRRKCTPCNPQQFQWKDVSFLTRFQTPTGKLMSRKRTGFCSQCQKKLAIAVKRARFMALIPYTT